MDEQRAVCLNRHSLCTIQSHIVISKFNLSMVRKQDAICGVPPSAVVYHRVASGFVPTCYVTLRAGGYEWWLRYVCTIKIFPTRSNLFLRQVFLTCEANVRVILGYQFLTRGTNIRVYSRGPFLTHGANVRVILQGAYFQPAGQTYGLLQGAYS